MRLIALVIPFLFAVSLPGEEVFAVKEGENRFSYYIQDDKDAGLYYKSGIKTPQTALRPTAFLKIAFLPGTEPDPIISSYSLRYIKSYPSYTLYEAPSPQESVAIASKIWEEKGVRFAIPFFERKKQLK